MDYTEAREKLREAKREALANSCNIKVGRRELEVALDALSKPDMREKVKEYISELDEEIERCEKLYIDSSVDYSDLTKPAIIQCRIETLTQVKNDLESRLEELV